MPVIIAENLSKSYRVHQKSPGLLGAVTNLVKRDYKLVEAANNISFTIGEGELVGFIGPNGAGKTTTLKMLSGLLYPTSGHVKVLGHDPWQRDFQFLTQISLVMGQKNQLWWDLPAIESFNLARDIYGIPEKKYQKTLSELVELLGIYDVLNVQVRKLSLGQRMKAELVAALIHAPKVLFLDEPTIGLDVVMQNTVRGFIRDYNQSHRGAIILTSHYMADVKELCRRVIIIDHGRILYDGLLADIIARFSSHKIIEAVTAEGTRCYRVKRGAVPQKTSDILKNNKVIDLNIKDPDIEEIIRDVFNKSHA